MIRAAVLEDLDALIALETSCFPGDRLSVRQFRRFIKSDNSRTLIIEQRGVVQGYALVESTPHEPVRYQVLWRHGGQGAAIRDNGRP